MISIILLVFGLAIGFTNKTFEFGDYSLSSNKFKDRLLACGWFDCNECDSQSRCILCNSGYKLVVKDKDDNFGSCSFLGCLIKNSKKVLLAYLLLD